MWLQEYFAFFLSVSIVIGVLLVLAAGASLYIVTYTIFMATVFTIGSYVMIFVGASELFILQCVGAGEPGCMQADTPPLILACVPSYSVRV